MLGEEVKLSLGQWPSIQNIAADYSGLHTLSLLYNNAGSDVQDTNHAHLSKGACTQKRE